jgi:hypothetical protein
MRPDNVIAALTRLTILCFFYKLSDWDLIRFVVVAASGQRCPGRGILAVFLACMWLTTEY